MEHSTMNSNEPFKMIISVYLSTGAVIEHVIDIPDDMKKAKEKIYLIIDRIHDTLDSINGEKRMLVLENPYHLYNVSHIVYVHPFFKTPEQWKEFVIETLKEKEPIGFYQSRQEYK